MDEPGANSPPLATGRAAYAARARVKPDGDVWFTVGQAWAFDKDGEVGYTVRIAMTPTHWDGELLLVPIPESESPTD